MKRILSVLLALVMVIGMLPMSILSASAADTTEVVFELGANGSASHYDGTEKSTYSETVNGVALSITGGTKMYTGARDAKGNSCIKLGTSSKSGSFSIAVPDDVTSVTINVAAYKAKTATVTVNGTATKLTTKSDNGAYDAITVDTTNAKTVSFAVTSGYRAMINSIVFTVSSGSEGEETCEHADATATEAVAATCTEVGYTAGVWCPDCEKYIEGHEQVPVLPHTETVTEEKAVTCTEDGYTKYTCSVCNATRTERTDATGHNYVDGICANEGCGLALPTDLAGKYYIAAIYSADGSTYQYMTNDLGTASTLRYQIVDSKLTTLPESIEDIVESQLFELIKVEGGYIIKTGEQYLGYTTGNSGALVTEDAARVVTIEYSTTEGAYNIHFTAAADDERYLALNNAAGSPWYAWYKGAGNQIQDLYLVPVSETAEVCKHTNTTTTTVDAKCDVAGSITVTCNDCGATISTETIAALGHSYTDGVCDNCGEEEVIVPSEATITFDDATKRTEFTTEIQVWKENAVTVTNNKASSSSNVGDYVKPARFYQGSTVTVEYPGMTKIVFNCSNATYATALGNSITGATVNVNDKVVTVELANAVNSFTTGGMNAQVRVDSLTVYTTKVCNHVWGEPVLTTAPSCAVEGENTFTCTLCGGAKTEAVAALGHVAADGFCSVCGGEFYTLATTLKNNDSVVIFNPANGFAMGAAANGTKMSAIATGDVNGFAVTNDMAVMQVQYVEGSETDFYLINNGKYLTSGATGNSMSFADTATEYSVWYMEVPYEGVVVITNRNAKFTNTSSGVTSEQSIEYYDGAFTTYSKDTGKAYQMKLYTKAAPAEPVAKIEDVEYTSFADAYAAATEGQIIKLLDEITVDAGSALDKNVVIDLNGNTLNVIDETITGAVVVKDSVTDSFADGETGTLNDNGFVKVAAAAGYLAIYDDVEEYYTFHAYQVKLTHVSLDPTNDALGYKAQLLGDSKVQAAVTSYGFNMGVAGGVMKTFTKNAENFDGIFSLRLQNIMAANGGEMDIQAEAFVNFANVTDPVKSNSHSTTMRETLEYVNNNLSKFDAVQIVAIQGMITEFESKMTGWNIDSIKAWTATEA